MNYGFHGNMEARPSMAGIAIVSIVVIIACAIFAMTRGGDADDRGATGTPPAATAVSGR